LRKYGNEEFVGETDDERVTFTLGKARRRFDGREPESRYRFETISLMPFGIDGEDEGRTNPVAG
jgi:hypothetical protein